MESHSEDSCWQWALPTAFLHFFTVECLHIYLAVLSWWSLVVDVNVKVALLQNGISLGPFTNYYSDLYFKGSAKEVRVVFNDNAPIKLPAVTVMTHQTDVPWLILDWAFLAAAAVLLLYCFVSFFLQGPFWSFGDGKYVHFTWRIPRHPIYQYCVWTMTIAAIILPVLWIAQVFVYTEGEMMSNNIAVFVHSWKSGFLLLFALGRLGSFRLGLCSLSRAPSYWRVRRSSDPIQNVALARRPEQMFTSANTSLEPMLLDALWAAEHGDLSRLARCLRDPGGAEQLWQSCKRAQTEYGATRDAAASLEDGRGATLAAPVEVAA